MITHKSIFAIVTVFICSVTATNVNCLDLAVIESTFEESYLSTPLSGKGLLGVMATGIDESLDFSFITVWMPEHNSDTLSVDVKSADGKYKAHAKYDIRNISPGTYNLRFPTEYEDSLRDYRIDELAILASYRCSLPSDSNSADQSSQFYVISSWVPVSAPDSLVICFTSGGAPITRLVVLTADSNSTVTYSQSSPWRLRYNTAYDALFRIAVDSNLKLDGAVIVRKNSDQRPLRAIELPIIYHEDN